MIKKKFLQLHFEPFSQSFFKNINEFFYFYWVKLEIIALRAAKKKKKQIF